MALALKALLGLSREGVELDFLDTSDMLLEIEENRTWVSEECLRLKKALGDAIGV